MGVRARVAVVVGTKGRGSNMQALIRAGQSGAMNADVALVYGPSPDAPALAAAADLGVEVAGFSSRDEEFGGRLLSTFRPMDIGLICLAGYLRLLPTEVLAAYPGRVLNIHPALLPKFGGKGMYGIHVHEAVLAAGETESGCTVHLVTDHYDEGEIVLRRVCPVLPGDTAETLAARVLIEEHLAYPEAVNMILGGHGG